MKYAGEKYMEVKNNLEFKRIKICPGIAVQCRGQMVDAKPHPRFKGSWTFQLKGETWVGSDWGFEENYKKENRNYEETN